MIKFLPLGGAGEIGASCFYLNIAGSGIILDCGMHPQKKGLDSLPDFDLIKNEPVDYVLISHAHQDHIGALPYLVQKHPYVKIVTTPQTRAIAELTLHNSVSILQEQLEEDSLLKVYSHDEIDLLIKSIDYKLCGDVFTVNGYKHNSSIDLTACFYDAGHILGSACILIELGEFSLFYSGDINLDHQALLPGAVIPEKKVEILITETTYGATKSEDILSWDNEAQRMASSINMIFVNGGSILIPVFSLGKMQEMITTIWNLIVLNKIPAVDIYTGGIAQKISRVYDYSKYVVNRIDPEFEISSIPQKDLYSIENYNDLFKNQCIVLAPSGMMLERTTSYNLARRWIKQKDSAIFFVGYVDRTTPGYSFSRAATGDKIKINDEYEDVKCIIKKFNFSAHSKREGLLEIVGRLSPDKVVLVHGDSSSIDWMGMAIKNKYDINSIYRAEKGKAITL